MSGAFEVVILAEPGGVDACAAGGGPVLSEPLASAFFSAALSPVVGTMVAEPGGVDVCAAVGAQCYPNPLLRHVLLQRFRQ